MASMCVATLQIMLDMSRINKKTTLRHTPHMQLCQVYNRAASVTFWAQQKTLSEGIQQETWKKFNDAKKKKKDIGFILIKVGPWTIYSVLFLFFRTWFVVTAVWVLYALWFNKYVDLYLYYLHRYLASLIPHLIFLYETVLKWWSQGEFCWNWVKLNWLLLS